MGLQRVGYDLATKPPPPPLVVMVQSPSSKEPNLPTIKRQWGTSLVVQWLRICLAMQRIPVQPLVWEDPSCVGAVKPVCHSYWACAWESVSHSFWARVLQLLKPHALEPVLHRRECVFTCVQLFETLWTVACQAPLSMEFFRARILEGFAIS